VATDPIAGEFTLSDPKLLVTTDRYREVERARRL
jgi:hypothetical protein